MSNVTESDCVAHAPWWDWFRFGLKLVCVITNGLIILPIVRYQALRRRKEYVMIAGLAFADCMRAMTKANSNLQRVIIYMFGLDCSLSSIMFCMVTVHAPMKFFDASSVIMLFVISCDRLKAVWKPIRYFKATHRYAIKFVCLAYGLATLNMIAATIDTFDRMDKMVSPRCLGPTMFSKFYLATNKSMESIISASSVVVYMFVPIMYRRETMNRVKDQGGQQMERFRQNQKKIMITLGMSSICTLLLDSMPRIMGYYFKIYLPKYNWHGVKFGQGLAQLPTVNGIFNFIFCFKRHSELRYALKAAIRCKTLPANMNNWTGFKPNAAKPPQAVQK